jgi:FeS cluster assembly scaffold protein NifU
MKSTSYSEKTLDHFRNPRNVGVLEGPDVAVGKVGNPVCGDLMEVFIKVENNIIVDAKFRTFGCGSAIATSSMTTEMVKGMTLEEALQVTREDVATELDGLPPIKMHCSNLAADALHEAIRDYQRSRGEKVDINKEIDYSEPECYIGKDEYLDKGLYLSVDNPEEFKDLRVLVVHTGDESVDAAIEITGFTDRVVLLTASDSISTTEKLERELANSKVKVLYQSRLLEIRGEHEVEKALIRNLEEDENYELFVDAIIIIE